MTGPKRAVRRAESSRDDDWVARRLLARIDRLEAELAACGRRAA